MKNEKILSTAKWPALRSVATKGFIDPLSLITLGIVVVGLVITAFIVKNPDIKLVCMDPCQTNADCNTNEYCYRPATGCSICKPKASPPPSSIPSPSPSPTTITQADCNECLRNNSPSECSGVCQNIGGTIITQTGQAECTAREKLCKPKPGPFADLPGLGTYGLAGNSSIPLPHPKAPLPPKQDFNNG